MKGMSVEDFDITLELTDSDSARCFTFTNATGDKIVLTFENEGASFFVSTGNTSKLNGNFLAGNIELNKRVDVNSVSINVSGMTPNTDGKYEILKGKTAIVVDDMISSGGSMFDVINELIKYFLFFSNY